MLTNETVAKIRDESGPEAVKAAIRQDAKERTEEKAQKARRENKDFTQIYPRGWNRLRELMKKDPQAATLYAFLAEQMGPDGSISASRTTLAQALDVGERTVSRHVKSLEDLGAIIVLKNGTTNVYCLNPAEVWKSFDNAKPYAAFNTRTLVSKSENPFVKKRLAVLLDGQLPKEKTLLDVMEGGDDGDTGIDFNDFADPAE
jgi:DNA-binding transcriptional ArsR family regulator